MDFGNILSKWEKKNTGKAFYDKDTVESSESSSERRSRLLRKKPDATIDLHGLRSDEAWNALENFFQEARASGFEKLLIIHGKGNHSVEGKLKDLSRRYIESCPFAGESGYSTGRDGGSGASWVILKDMN